MCDLKALNAEPIRVFKQDGDGEVDIRALDAMVERFLTEEASFVVDSGATTFVPLSSHLVMNQAVVDALAEAGKQMVVHAIISGGPELVHCAKGLDAMASQFPADVRIVVWVNEHHGKIQVNGKTFEDAPVYQMHKDRISGLIHLPRLNPVTFGADVAEMLSKGITFAEADKSPEFFAMTKQRLRQVWRPIREQLGPVL